MSPLEKRVHDIDHMLTRFASNIASRVAELEKRVTELEQGAVSFDDDVRQVQRQQRWHATVNACLSHGHSLANARNVANELHGSLTPADGGGGIGTP